MKCDLSYHCCISRLGLTDFLSEMGSKVIQILAETVSFKFFSSTFDASHISYQPFD
jgi:hypothetical protein